MSKLLADRYRKMIDAGTCDLAMIDAAEQKRFVTAAEAEELRAYWHAKNDPPPPPEPTPVPEPTPAAGEAAQEPTSAQEQAPDATPAPEASTGGSDSPSASSGDAGSPSSGGDA